MAELYQNIISAFSAGAFFGVFLGQKLAGKPFTVVGEGKQTRDFTYVPDIAQAIPKFERSHKENKTQNLAP